MAYSTVPAVKVALLTIIQGIGGLSGVLVARGVPAEPPPEQERVYIDNAVEINREWAGIGQFKLDEEYIVRIPIEVYQPGNDQPACEDRMWQIVALIEQAVIADLTLNGILDGPGHAKPAGCEDQNSFAAPDGWISHTVLRIDCKARI
jgi:hypothetical protein